MAGARILVLVFVLGFAQLVFADSQSTEVKYEIAKLRFAPECILNAVAKHKNIKLRADMDVPKINFQSTTSLKQFQDDVESQWNMRPDLVVNVYILKINTIYLLDEAAYYQKLHRFLDDSLAHEFTHYLQVKYENVDLNVDADAAEGDAISAQEWFRDTFLKNGATKNPCNI